MAESDIRLESLEDEVKVLKGEVKRTLVDLRALLMREDSPLAEGALARRMALQNPGPAPAAAPAPAVVPAPAPTPEPPLPAPEPAAETPVSVQTPAPGPGPGPGPGAPPVGVAVTDGDPSTGPAGESSIEPVTGQESVTGRDLDLMDDTAAPGNGPSMAEPVEDRAPVDTAPEPESPAQEPPVEEPSPPGPPPRSNGHSRLGGQSLEPERQREHQSGPRAAQEGDHNHSNGKSEHVISIYDEYRELLAETRETHTLEDLPVGPPLDVNLLSNLVYWASLAKQRVGEQQLKDLLQLYIQSGHSSPELQTLLLHVCQMVDVPQAEMEENGSDWVDLMFHLHGILTGGFPVIKIPQIQLKDLSRVEDNS